MRALRVLLIGLLLVAVGCQAPADEGAESSSEGQTEQTGGEAEAEPEAQPEPEAPAEPVEDSFADGVYATPRFNIRFRVPDGWTPLQDGEAGPFGIGTSEDSLTIVGPGNIRMVIANSESVQLVGESFGNLDDRVGFENVNIVPERSRGGTFNGVPGYRTEGDALLRGDAVPVAFISQALDLPGRPTMATIFIPFDLYSACYGTDGAPAEDIDPEGTGEIAPLADDCEQGYYSDVMKSVLDSIEVIDLQRAQ